MIDIILYPMIHFFTVKRCYSLLFAVIRRYPSLSVFTLFSAVFRVLGTPAIIERKTGYSAEIRSIGGPDKHGVIPIGCLYTFIQEKKQ